jgi:hypothetical protein
MNRAGRDADNNQMISRKGAKAQRKREMEQLVSHA